MAQDKSGPAFPLQSIGPEFPPGHSGMTLRDWFAGRALTGLLASEANDSIEYTTARAASVAYRLADEMLKAREA